MPRKVNVSGGTSIAMFLNLLKIFTSNTSRIWLSPMELPPTTTGGTTSIKKANMTTEVKAKNVLPVASKTSSGGIINLFDNDTSDDDVMPAKLNTKLKPGTKTTGMSDTDFILSVKKKKTLSSSVLALTGKEYVRLHDSLTKNSDSIHVYCDSDNNDDKDEVKDAFSQELLTQSPTISPTVRERKYILTNGTTGYPA
jgi:hypothetical protein